MTDDEEIVKIEQKLFGKRIMIKPSKNQHSFITIEERLKRLRRLDRLYNKERLKRLRRLDRLYNKDPDLDKGYYLMQWGVL